jgi:hypothetical protein
MSTGQIHHPSKPRVGMSGFAEYLTAGTSRRIDCVRQQIETYAESYRPGAAFYKEFIDAVVAGRRNGTDAASLQDCIESQRVDARRAHYSLLREHWLAMPMLHRPLQAVGRARWEVDSLAVGVSPDFAVTMKGGEVLVVKLRLRESVLSRDGIMAMQWLMTQHMPTLYPGGTAAVVDLRRRCIHRATKRRLKRGYEVALRSEAESMGSLWRGLTLLAASA